MNRPSVLRSEVEAALQAAVVEGLLRLTSKNGEDAYVETTSARRFRYYCRKCTGTHKRLSGRGIEHVQYREGENYLQAT